MKQDLLGKNSLTKPIPDGTLSIMVMVIHRDLKTRLGF